MLWFGCKFQGQCLWVFDTKDSLGNFWIHWEVIITNTGICMTRLCYVGWLCFTMLSLFWAHHDLQYVYIGSHPAFWAACIGSNTNFISLISNTNQAFQHSLMVNLRLVTKKRENQDPPFRTMGWVLQQLVSNSNFFLPFFLQLNFHLEKQSDRTKWEPLQYTAVCKKQKTLQPG